MAAVSQRMLLTVAFVATFIGVATQSRADMGPNFSRSSYLVVQLDDKPIVGEAVTVAVLDCGPAAQGQRPSHVAGFEREEIAPLSNARWLWTTTSPANQSEARVRLLPLSFQTDHIKLVLRIGNRKTVYVTNEVETHPLFEQYSVDLYSDGRAVLRLDRQGAAWVDWLLTIWRWGFVQALALTCLVEGLVVAAIGRWQRISLPRLVLRSVLANLLTLPLVWCATLAAFGITNSIPVGISVLVLAELATLVFECLLYTLRQLAKPSQALLLSAVANTSSVAVGLLISAMPVAGQ